MTLGLTKSMLRVARRLGFVRGLATPGKATAPAVGDAEVVVLETVAADPSPPAEIAARLSEFRKAYVVGRTTPAKSGFRANWKTGGRPHSAR